MAALYIHIPFCKTRCNYCDFYKSTSCAKTEDYIEALEREMEYRRGYFGDTPVDTVFFGGGTPSLLPPALLQRLIAKARSLWKLVGYRNSRSRRIPTTSPNTIWTNSPVPTSTGSVSAYSPSSTATSCCSADGTTPNRR